MNIVNYIFSRKWESDLVLEFLILMVFNEIFDNIFVFIVSFFIENVIILDYLEYMCKIINLIFKKKLSWYLKFDLGLWIILIFLKKSLLFVIVFGIVLGNIKWY